MLGHLGKREEKMDLSLVVLGWKELLFHQVFVASLYRGVWSGKWELTTKIGL